MFVNANPGSTTSWVNFLIEYGGWTDPEHCGECTHIPGHNSTYKRDTLLEYGQKLSEFLEAESTMQWDMIRRGHRFYLESKARSFHLNFSRIRPSVRLRFYAGRLFAANRARKWSVSRRLFYTLGSPLIPVVRFLRILKAVYNARSCRLPILLPTLLGLLVMDGLGEMVGMPLDQETRCRNSLVLENFSESGS